MFIQKFFTPKWKNKNPVIRKEALEGLNPDKDETQKIFSEVVKVDNDVTIRRMVVGRLTDIELLQYLQNTHVDLAESATKRIRQLIAGVAKYPIDIEQRKQALAKFHDQETVEYVARNAKEAQLRIMAVEEIKRQSLLGDLAVNDDDQELRLAALEKISQTSTLDRVYKNSRLKDKRVSALAKQRLDKLVEQQQRPITIKKEAKQRCLDLDSLVQRCKKNGQWLTAKDRFDAIQSAWQNNKQQWMESYGEWNHTLSRNFSELTEQFEERYRTKAQEEADKRAQEEKAEPYKAQKRRVCDDLQRKLDQLKSLSQPAGEQLEELEIFLQQCNQLWNEAEAALLKEKSVASADHDEINNRFYHLTNDIIDYKKDLRIWISANKKQNELAEKTTALLNDTQFLDANVVKVVQTDFQKLPQSKHYIPDEALQTTLRQNLDSLQQRLEEQEKQKQENIDQFVNLVAELDKSLKSGKTKHAVNLSNRGRKLLSVIPQNDKQLLQKKKLLKQFHDALNQLSELQSWRQWSNSPVKEQLCARMQQLARQVEENQENPDFDFQDAAQRVKEARAEWKKLTTAQPHQADELWEAFDSACTRAYEPCQQYFKQQTETRRENLLKRQQACESLEEYLQVLSHKPVDLIDWKALDKIVRVAQDEWRTMGAVDRKDRAQINKRFRDVINALRKLQLDHKSHNKEEKELLIKRAETVEKQLAEDKMSLREATDGIKQLQADWKNIGVAVGDGELWKHFRGICDEVFKRRDQENAAVREERQKIIDSRAAVCSAIEELVKLEGDELKAAQKHFEELKQQWSTLPSLQSSSQQKQHPKQVELEKRFNHACRAFEAQNKRRIAAENQQRLEVQRQQAAFCITAEQLLFSVLGQQISLEQSLQDFTNLENQWQELPSYSHAVSKSLQHRFEQSKFLLEKIAQAGSASVAEELRQQEADKVAEKQLLCLQMEVLTNTESPADAQQARMEYQVSQLADKMKQNDTDDIATQIDGLLVKWHGSGVLNPELNHPLEERFRRAMSISQA